MPKKAKGDFSQKELFELIAMLSDEEDKDGPWDLTGMHGKGDEPWVPGEDYFDYMQRMFNHYRGRPGERPRFPHEIKPL